MEVEYITMEFMQDLLKLLADPVPACQDTQALLTLWLALTVGWHIVSSGRLAPCRPNDHCLTHLMPSFGGAGGGGGDLQVYHPSMLLCRGMIKRASYWEGAKVPQAALMAKLGDKMSDTVH